MDLVDAAIDQSTTMVDGRWKSRDCVGNAGRAKKRVRQRRRIGRGRVLVRASDQSGGWAAAVAGDEDGG